MPPPVGAPPPSLPPLCLPPPIGAPPPPVPSLVPPFHVPRWPCAERGAQRGGARMHLPRWRAAPALCTPPPPGLPTYPIRHMHRRGATGDGVHVRTGRGCALPPLHPLCTPFAPPLRGTEGQGNAQTKQGDPT